jgi:hypothetical protein
LFAAAPVQQPGGDGAPIGKQIVEDPGALHRFAFDLGRRDQHLKMAGADELAHLAGIGTLVHAGTIEAHADGQQRTAARGKRSNEAGIQAAREQQA